MEILAVLLAISILGNLFCCFLFYRMAIKKPFNPEQLLQNRRDEIAPFISQSNIRPADAVELSEVDEELVKKSIKKALSKEKVEEVDDEAPDIYNNT